MVRCSSPAIAVLFWLVCIGRATSAAEPKLATVSDGDGQPVAVELRGLSDHQVAQLKQSSSWPAVFEVRVGGTEASSPAMDGSFEFGESVIRFMPRFRLQPAVAYRAQTTPASASIVGRIQTDFKVPEVQPAEPTSVAAIYPSADQLPENQLKFYLHFTAPMSRGQAYQRVRLLRENGEAVDLPFLEIGEELWDSTGKRLTLLIDPGRIKRGVKPREDIGPVLEAGQRYTLTVDEAWEDATGRPLRTGYQKSFAAVAPVSEALDSKGWKLDTPVAGTRQALVVVFSAALDHALLQRTMWVESEAGEIEGRITTAEQEKSWRFEPMVAWEAGPYWLVVDTVLEDLAGNRIGSAFEVDALNPLQKRLEVKTIRLPLRIQTRP